MMPPQKAGGQNALHRVHRHHFQSGELLTGPHETNLGRERGTGPTRKQQGGHHGAQLAHQAQRHHEAQRLGRAIALQGVIALQTQHKAHKQARHGDDGQRVIAQKMHLVAHQAKALERCTGHAQQLEKQPSGKTPIGQHLAGGCAQSAQHVGDHADLPS